MHVLLKADMCTCYGNQKITLACLNYSGGTERLDELFYNFSILNDLTQVVNFPTLGSSTVTLTVLLFWIYLFLLMLVFVLQWLAVHWEILIMLLSQLPFSFQKTQNRIT